MWLLLVTTAVTYYFRICWLQLCFYMSWIFIRSFFFFFNVLSMLVWQEELDWNEMLIKRYIGREVYAHNSKQLNYASILLVMTLWNLLNCFFLFLIEKFDQTSSTNTALPLVLISSILSYPKSLLHYVYLCYFRTLSTSFYSLNLN